MAARASIATFELDIQTRQNRVMRQTDFVPKVDKVIREVHAFFFPWKMISYAFLVEIALWGSCKRWA